MSNCSPTKRQHHTRNSKTGCLEGEGPRWRSQHRSGNPIGDRATGANTARSYAFLPLLVILFLLVPISSLSADNPLPADQNANSGQRRSHKKVRGNTGNLRLPPARKQPDSQNNAKDQKLQILQKGTSSDQVRRQAIANIPWNKLSVRNRQRVQQVIEDEGLFRRLPVVAFDVEPDVYTFFAAHPDVAVSIWRAMEISKFQMWQTGKYEYEADAGDGCVGVIDVLHQGTRHNLLLCEGTYKSPFLLKGFQAKALVHLQTAFYEDDDGKIYASHMADIFVSLPSHAVEAAAKIISPIGNAIADRNFREISLFVRMMSMVMARRPGWVENLTQKLNGILEIRKSQLLKLSAQVYVAARKREVSRVSDVDVEEVSLEEVMKPLREKDRADSAQNRPKNADQSAPDSNSASASRTASKDKSSAE